MLLGSIILASALVACGEKKEEANPASYPDKPVNVIIENVVHDD